MLNQRMMARLTGNELVKLRQETVSFIFQDANLLNHLNALDNVAQPLRHQGVLPWEARKKAQKLLDRLGMGERSNGIPEELSGGEQQRVSIARALITKPKLILADEPTGALDPITSREILNIFKDLHKNEAVAFLVVTHNREVASFADRTLELRDGRFVAQHGTDVDIGDLTVSRELIIDETGTVTLPPDILAKIGGAGRFELPKLSKDIINFERVESDKIVIEEKGELVLSPNCPACRYDYGTGTLQMCPECGASRPMIKS